MVNTGTFSASKHCICCCLLFGCVYFQLLLEEVVVLKLIHFYLVLSSYHMDLVSHQESEVNITAEFMELHCNNDIENFQVHDFV